MRVGAQLPELGSKRKQLTPWLMYIWRHMMSQLVYVLRHFRYLGKRLPNIAHYTLLSSWSHPPKLETLSSTLVVVLMRVGSFLCALFYSNNESTRLDSSNICFERLWMTATAASAFSLKNAASHKSANIPSSPPPQLLSLMVFSLLHLYTKDDTQDMKI